jgi:hypothetical protein
MLGLKTQLQKLAESVSQYISLCAEGENHEARFQDLALELFAFQFENNPPYGKFCASLGRTPRNVTSWQQIPGVVTSAFKDLDLTALPLEERRTTFHSSGTTQQKPSRHFHNEITMALYELSLLTWFKEQFRLKREKRSFLFLTPPPKKAPNSSLVHMFATLGRDLANDYVFASQANSDGTWTIEIETLTDFLRGRSEAVIVCGTAFSFVHLHDALGTVKLALPIGSRVMETGGYKGRSRVVTKAELHGMICRMFQIRAEQVISEYGMSELSSQAYSHALTPQAVQSFTFPPWAKALVVSPENGREVGEGESGLLKIYDLVNVGSVMAIQTEDIAVRRGGGFELLGRARNSEARGCSLMAA